MGPLDGLESLGFPEWGRLYARMNVSPCVRDLEGGGALTSLPPARVLGQRSHTLS